MRTTAPKSAEDLFDVLECRKALAGWTDWRPIPPKLKRDIGGRQKLEMVSPLSHDGTVIEGVQLRISCPRNHANQHVAVMLMAIDQRRKPACFARIDWNSDPHENRHPVAADLHLTSAGGSHFHDPRLLVDWDMTSILSSSPDLPVAAPLSQNPASFTELLEIAAKLLHVEDMAGIDVPPWVETDLI